MSLVPILQQAFVAFGQRQIDEAKRLCREVLLQDGRQAQAHQLLGLIAQQQLQLDEALAHLRAAIECDPAQAQLHMDLAGALRAAGRATEAVLCCQEAVRLDPQSAPARNELGNALRESGRPVEAEGEYRRALELQPDMAEAYNNLGNALQDQKRHTDAVAAFKQAATLQPDSPIIPLNLGNCYRDMNMPGQAAAAYRRALVKDADFGLAHHSLGMVLLNIGNMDGAVEHQRKAIQLLPNVAVVHHALGLALHSQRQFEEAKFHYLKALELGPPQPFLLSNLAGIFTVERRIEEAHTLYQRAVDIMPGDARLQFNLGMNLQTQNRHQEAIVLHQKSLALNPQDSEVHYFHGMAHLALGEFQVGWEEFKWRLQTTMYADRSYIGPFWDGGPTGGKQIVAYAEGGLGDTIHFMRFAPMIAARAGKLVVEVQPRVVQLLEESGFANVVPKGTYQWRENTLQVSLLALPGMFVKDEQSIPAPIPYLSSPPARIMAWGERLREYRGYRVGIHWLGSSAAPLEGRDIALETFEPLSRIPGVTLFSLQQGDEDHQLAKLRGRFPIVELGDQIDKDGAFLDTAAILKNLDLLITCDTAIAHLAGALGLPVWVALLYSCDWRWMRIREDTPWYPTMRLFRQTKLYDWPGVFERIAAALAERVSSARTS